MTVRSVTTQEAILAGSIASALIQRGEFGAGAFDRLFPDGAAGDPNTKHDPEAARGLGMIAMFSLTAARHAIDTIEAGLPQPPEGDEWKDGTPPA